MARNDKSAGTIYGERTNFWKTSKQNQYYEVSWCLSTIFVQIQDRKQIKARVFFYDVYKKKLIILIFCKIYLWLLLRSLWLLIGSCLSKYVTGYEKIRSDYLERCFFAVSFVKKTDDSITKRICNRTNVRSSRWSSKIEIAIFYQREAVSRRITQRYVSLRHSVFHHRVSVKYFAETSKRVKRRRKWFSFRAVRGNL